MASLQHIKTGWQTGYRLRVCTGGKRHSVWLGPVREREAKAIQLHVEAVIQSQKLRTPLPTETQRWLRDLAAELRQRLSPVLGTSKSVDEAAEAYIAHVEATHKDTTARAAEDTISQFAAHFGSQSMRSINGDHIDTWLIRQNVAESTLGKHVKILRTWLKWCLAENLIDTIPSISTPATIGVGAKEYIDFSEFQKVIEYYAHDKEMQCILALSRWSGLRVASEIVTLRRSNIDIAGDRFIIDDSKRSHRQSRGPPKIRTLPLFSGLRPYVMALLDQPGKPTDYLLPTVGGQNAQRIGSMLRQRVYRALDKLGIPRWPKVFHSPRATRQTQLKDQFGEKAACDWIGNSPDVSRRNYELIDGETFARAVDA